MAHAWSYSSLSAFETCPRRFYLTRVSKEVTEPEGEALLWGSRVHKELETALLTGDPLPDTMRAHQPIIDRCLKLQGERLIERQIALDPSFRPCDWFDKDVWVRGVIDFGVVDNHKAVMLDWKTGKRKVNLDQLKLFALLVFHTFPDVRKVLTSFVWLKEGIVDRPEMWHRENLSEYWNEFLVRVARLEEAHETNIWRPKQSGLCRNWCPCTACEFCGNQR